MLQSKKNKFKPIWIILKLLIALAALLFIYLRVFKKENAADWWVGAGKSLTDPDNLALGILVICLMLLNWSVEAVKWKMVMARLEQLSFFKSLEAIFSGIAISFFTPNRIGEYAGRVFHLQKADRIEATLVTVLENFTQLIVTLVFGCLGSMIYMQQYSKIPPHIENTFLVLLFVVSASALLLLFNVSVVEAILKKLKLPDSWKKYFEVFGYYSNSMFTKLLLLATLRYLIFTLQYYILLRIFDVDLSYFLSMILISVTFVVMSVVPTFALTELGVRSAVATFFFSAVTGNIPGVINASFSLWLINLAFPAVLGSFFIFEFKFGKRK